MAVVHLSQLARLCAIVASLLACASCTARTHTHVLRIADGAGDLPSLNPHLTMGATMDEIGQLSLAYFMRYDRSARLRPELITVVPSLRNGGVSADGRRITWHLRRGVRWSDGAPFDARDVVFTIGAILNPRNDEIGGVEGWNLIRRVETPDRYTVVYDLARPYGALIPLSFTPVGGGPCVLPEHLLGKLRDINTAAYNALPVGIGPFRIVAWKRGDSIEMEPNPFYWRGRPKLKHITYKLIPSRETLLAQLHSGEVDLWPTVPPTYVRRVGSIAGLRSDSQPNLRTTHLDFMMLPSEHCGPGGPGGGPLEHRSRPADPNRRAWERLAHGCDRVAPSARPARRCSHDRARSRPCASRADCRWLAREFERNPYQSRPRIDARARVSSGRARSRLARRSHARRPSRGRDRARQPNVFARSPLRTPNRKAASSLMVSSMRPCTHRRSSRCPTSRAISTARKRLRTAKIIIAGAIRT